MFNLKNLVISEPQKSKKDDLNEYFPNLSNINDHLSISSQIVKSIRELSIKKSSEFQELTSEIVSTVYTKLNTSPKSVLFLTLIECLSYKFDSKY